MEIWALVEKRLLDDGERDAADALSTGIDGYLRTAEIFGLRGEDISITGAGTSEMIVSLRLGVPERGESTNTGIRQGVIIDWPCVADMLARRRSSIKGSDKVFGISVDRYRRTIARASVRLGLADLGPAHSVRHSGPSHDAATAYRTIWQIQRRGRWASEKSVMRYAKTHTLNEARSRFKQQGLDAGLELLSLRLPRPEKARE